MNGETFKLLSTSRDKSRSLRVRAPGAELHVEVQGDGPFLLLVAGLGGQGAFWRYQVAEFARDHTVVTFDQRGCGQSSANVVTQSTAQLARDTLAIMDALGIERAIGAGHSTGGAILQHLALAEPDRLERLVFANSWAGPDRYLTEYFAMREAILKSCGPEVYIKTGVFMALPSGILQPSMDEHMDNVTARLESFPGSEVELSRIAAILAHDLRERLHDIAIPTLCIGAEDDQVIPVGHTHELGDLISGARKLIFERSGHLSPITRADSFNQALREFFTG